MKIDHIGIAVKNLEESITIYEKFLDMKVTEIESVPTEKVKVGIFKLPNVRIELLMPTDETSPIAIFINKRGEGIHHIAFGVDNIADTEERLKGHEFRLINEKFKIGAENCLVNFIHPKSLSGVLTEISQREKHS